MIAIATAVPSPLSSRHRSLGFSVSRRWIGKKLFYLVELFAQSFGQTGVSVRGQGQRDSSERGKRDGDRTAAGAAFAVQRYQVWERFEHDEHEHVRVRDEQCAGLGSHGDGQQLADQRPREHEHAGRAAAHERCDAKQRQKRHRICAVDGRVHVKVAGGIGRGYGRTSQRHQNG